MTSEILTVLGVDLLAALALMGAIAVPSFKTKDPSYVDGFWGIGFVVVAVVAFVQTDGDGTRKGWLLGLTALWGLRLGGYLLWRWAGHGPDPRYQKMLAKNTGSDAVFLLTRVFLTQAVILTVVALPVQLGQVYDGGFRWWNWVGVVGALAAIAWETVADVQLTRFRGNPDNKGQVMDKGLWRYSRHPNYFGEACVWWSLLLVSWVNPVSAFGIIGPLLITAFLAKWSGVGPLEKQLHDTKPKYKEYVATTSALVPRPPKRA